MQVLWCLARTCGLSLEVGALLLLALPAPPSHHTARRSLLVVAVSTAAWGGLTCVLELTDPAKEFHVFSTCTAMYGEGGGLYTALTALLLALLYSCLLATHLCDRKSRPALLTYLVLLLVTQATRATGGLLLYHDLSLGLCLSNLSLYLLVACLPALASACLLRPLLAGGPGHSMLQGGLGYSRQEDGGWGEEEEDGMRTRTGGEEEEGMGEDDLPL